jgi:Nucleotide-diphospho-sugar transferase
VQVDLARLLMEEHNFQQVVWTDTDVVWLRNPLPYLALRPTADIAIQTDCLSHIVEANYTLPFQHGVARCGHLPGNTFNNAFNTGMILFRKRPSTLAFLTAWLDYLLDANRMYIDLGGGARAIVGDQLAFNTLITEGAKPWQSVDPAGDWRVLWAHNHSVHVRLLSLA